MTRLNVQTSSEYTVADQERMKAAQRYFQWQSRLAEKQLGRRVLEVGCGMGNFTSQLENRELIIGLDVDEQCLELWRQRFAGKTQYQGFHINAEDPEFLNLAK